MLVVVPNCAVIGVFTVVTLLLQPLSISRLVFADAVDKIWPF